MRLIQDLSQVQLAAPSAVTVGVFDGVHLGHQRIIARMVASAHAAGRLAVAYTFDPHPVAAVGRTAPPLLTTLSERAQILSVLGLDILAVPPFSAETARIGAGAFADLLIGHFRMVELWAGPDFALGHRREGDIAYLTELGAERGFQVHVVPPVECAGGLVSSSRIRSDLARGELGRANECLGRLFTLSGRYEHQPHGGAEGAQVGRLSLTAGRLVPAAGEYACRATADGGETQPCVATVGRATAPDEGPTVEVALPRGLPAPQARWITLEFHALLDGAQAVDHREPRAVDEGIRLAEELPTDPK